jgi:hypothetical protein
MIEKDLGSLCSPSLLVETLYGNLMRSLSLLVFVYSDRVEVSSKCNSVSHAEMRGSGENIVWNAPRGDAICGATLMPLYQSCLDALFVICVSGRCIILSLVSGSEGRDVPKSFLVLHEGKHVVRIPCALYVVSWKQLSTNVAIQKDIRSIQKSCVVICFMLHVNILSCKRAIYRNSSTLLFSALIFIISYRLSFSS